MTLSNYGSETHERYSNDTGVRALGSAAAVARVAFPSASNVYSVDVAWVAEDGGTSADRLSVGGVVMTAWTSAAARLDYVEFNRRAGSAERAGLSGGEPGRLVNLSVRAELIGAGETLTLGLVLAGRSPTTTQPLLVRAAGPALRAFGVGTPLENPSVEFYAGQTRVTANDGWGGSDSLVAAFALPATSRDVALVATLEPGSYTVHAADLSGAGGHVLLEIYEVP